jgi:hypothetical protein
LSRELIVLKEIIPKLDKVIFSNLKDDNGSDKKRLKKKISNFLYGEKPIGNKIINCLYEKNFEDVSLYEVLDCFPFYDKEQNIFKFDKTKSKKFKKLK